MKNQMYLTLLAIIALATIVSCHKKPPKITETIELSPEMKAYFVDYKVGTKWIYQDTLNPNIYDTIELISVENFDIVSGNTLKKGFVLYYKPKKSKDFKVRVNPGNNNSCFVKIDPLVSAAGAVVFENYNGVWADLLNYYDNIEIKGNKYCKVVSSPSTNSYIADVYISSSNGIISFWKYAEQSWAFENYFKLIKTIYP